MSMITYADKETLNAQPSIADKNKCTANDMNEIKSVINNKVGDVTNLNTTDKTSVVNAVNELKGGEAYSTTEVKTNKIWIDGKPIYRKVITTGTISSTNKDVFYSMNMNASDIGQITKIDGIFNINIGSLPVNFHNENNTSYDTLAYYNIQQTVARIGVRNNYAITSGYIVVEYTKAS